LLSFQLQDGFGLVNLFNRIFVGDAFYKSLIMVEKELGKAINIKKGKSVTTGVPISGLSEKVFAVFPDHVFFSETGGNFFIESDSNFLSDQVVDEVD
jgi:hypothetical protein